MEVVPFKSNNQYSQINYDKVRNVLNQIENYFVNSMHGNTDTPIVLDYQLPENIVKLDKQNVELKNYSTLTICVQNSSNNNYELLSNHVTPKAYISVNGKLTDMQSCGITSEEVFSLITNWPEIKQQYDKERDTVMNRLAINQNMIENFNLYPDEVKANIQKVDFGNVVETESVKEM